MELTLQDKLKLIKLFEFLLDEEISKPLGEMNSEAVDNYIKILLDLQDKHAKLSSEYINEQVRKIFHPEDAVIPETAKTTKKYFNKKKVWLVAACIAILVALFSIVSFSSERSVKDILEDYLGTFEFISFGDEVDIGDETYIKVSENRNYNSIEDAVKTEKVSLLFPSCLLNDYDTHLIIADVQNNTRHLAITFENTSISLEIFFNSEIKKEIMSVCNKHIKIDNIEYHLCVMEDVNQAQAYFIHNNNMYLVTHYDEKSLMEILNNMEEIKYEN